jgi:hypothetical protein
VPRRHPQTGTRPEHGEHPREILTPWLIAVDLAERRAVGVTEFGYDPATQALDVRRGESPLPRHGLTAVGFAQVEHEL